MAVTSEETPEKIEAYTIVIPRPTFELKSDQFWRSPKKKSKMGWRADGWPVFVVSKPFSPGKNSLRTNTRGPIIAAVRSNNPWFEKVDRERDVGQLAPAAKPKG